MRAKTAKKLFIIIAAAMITALAASPAMAEETSVSAINITQVNESAKRSSVTLEEPYGNSGEEGSVSGGFVKTCSPDGRRDCMLEPVAAKYAYTDEDLSILAHVIAGEAQGYSDQEQQFVASVVMNRVSSGAYPNTVREVVFQKGQYACTWDGNFYREPTAANWENARIILEKGSILPGNVVYQSMHKQGKGVYVKTSRHYYCYS